MDNQEPPTLLPLQDAEEMTTEREPHLETSLTLLIALKPTMDNQEPLPSLPLPIQEAEEMTTEERDPHEITLSLSIASAPIVDGTEPLEVPTLPGTEETLNQSSDIIFINGAAQDFEDETIKATQPGADQDHDEGMPMVMQSSTQEMSNEEMSKPTQSNGDDQEVAKETKPEGNRVKATRSGILTENEIRARTVGEKTRDQKRLKDRLKELKKRTYQMGSEDDISTPDDSISEDEGQDGSEARVEEICSEQEAHKRYWALTKQKYLDERLEQEISSEFSIRGILRTMEVRALPHQPSIIQLKIVESRAELTFEVYGGAVGETDEEHDLVKDYLDQARIRLKATELLKKCSSSQGTDFDYDTAKVELTGHSSISETGLESASGEFKEQEFWRFSTLVRLSKIPNTRFKIAGETSQWAIKNHKIFKAMITRVVKWAIGRVRQVIDERSDNWAGENNPNEEEEGNQVNYERLKEDWRMQQWKGREDLKRKGQEEDHEMTEYSYQTIAPQMRASKPSPVPRLMQGCRQRPKQFGIPLVKRGKKKDWNTNILGLTQAVIGEFKKLKEGQDHIQREVKEIRNTRTDSSPIGGLRMFTPPYGRFQLKKEKEQTPTTIIGNSLYVMDLDSDLEDPTGSMIKRVSARSSREREEEQSEDEERQGALSYGKQGNHSEEQRRTQEDKECKPNQQEEQKEKLTVDLSAEGDEDTNSNQFTNSQGEQDGGFAISQQEETDRRKLSELEKGETERNDGNGGLTETKGREESKEDTEMLQQNGGSDPSKVAVEEDQSHLQPPHQKSDHKDEAKMPQENEESKSTEAVRNEQSQLQSPPPESEEGEAQEQSQEEEIQPQEGESN